MRLNPTPLTAAAAGAFSAVVLPLLRGWLGDDAGLDMRFTLALLLAVALPAHLLVIGHGRASSDGQPAMDKALLQRTGAWLLAAAGVWAIRSLT